MTTNWDVVGGESNRRPVKLSAVAALPRGQVEIDTSSTWPALRRVHFYISDLIFWDLDPLGVGVIERRILDTLAYAESQGATDGLPIATICDLVPPRLKPQTAASVLERMRDSGWVEVLSQGPGRGRGRAWRLNTLGREVREACKQIVEMILRENYHDATPQQLEALLSLSQAAMEFMDTRMAPVVHLADPAASREPDRLPNWAALRRTHFYVHDLIFKEVEPIGVGVSERRILDTLGFAEHRGAAEGITAKTVCDLIAAPIRSQAAGVVLERMQHGGWVEQRSRQTEGARSNNFWRLTDRGRHVRGVYKGFAESVIREVYGRQGRELGILLALAQTTERHRSVRLEPIIALAEKAGR